MREGSGGVAGAGGSTHRRPQGAALAALSSPPLINSSPARCGQSPRQRCWCRAPGPPVGRGRRRSIARRSGDVRRSHSCSSTVQHRGRHNGIKPQPSCHTHLHAQVALVDVLSLRLAGLVPQLAAVAAAAPPLHRSLGLQRREGLGCVCEWAGADGAWQRQTTARARACTQRAHVGEAAAKPLRRRAGRPHEPPLHVLDPQPVVAPAAAPLRAMGAAAAGGFRQAAARHNRQQPATACTGLQLSKLTGARSARPPHR